MEGSQDPSKILLLLSAEGFVGRDRAVESRPSRHLMAVLKDSGGFRLVAILIGILWLGTAAEWDPIRVDACGCSGVIQDAQDPEKSDQDRLQ